MSKLSLQTSDIPRFLRVRIDRRVSKSAPTVVLLHGIGTSAEYWTKIETSLPDNVNLMAVDLLGFGESPKPHNASYNLRIQARSLVVTLLRRNIRGKIIIVGHSMGALIAIEFTKRYGYLVKGLVLCSPPLYRTLTEKRQAIVDIDSTLRKVYQNISLRASQHPERYIKLAELATRLRIAPPMLAINQKTVGPYIAALRSSIIQQTSFEDIQHIKKPIYIIYGRFDPFIVNKNLTYLSNYFDNISVRSILESHEISKKYIKPIKIALNQLISP